MALALLRGLAKDEVRTGAWEENKMLMVIIVTMVKTKVAMMMAMTTSMMITTPKMRCTLAPGRRTR